MTINLPKWLDYIFCPNRSGERNKNLIPTICVDSPTLTASYYKEYLGFEVIIRSPINNRSILLKKKNNWVLIKSIDSKKTLYNQKLTLHLHRVDKEYSQLYDKVWVIKPCNPKSNEFFLIKDCNGIEIAYCSS